ncbi:VWA domain-containing protein [Nannocystaceae bacterium ST9]
MSWFLRVLGFGVVTCALVLVAVGLRLGQGLRHVVFASPWLLALLVVPLIGMAIRAATAPTPASFRFSRKQSLTRLAGGGLAVRLADLPEGLRLAACLLLALAAARPQSTRMSERLEHEGIDIAIVLDLSESMASDDIYPDRLSAAKAVIDDFIARRPNDRIALVGFGSTASTIAPLTLDHHVLRSLIARLSLQVIDGRSTAIGAGLGVGLNRLESSDATSKIMVLLTDGMHNADGIDPDSAAQEAANRGVIIYTVLMGRHDLGAGSVDPQQLERLASATGGYAYLATDVDELAGSFQALLDELEKSEIAGEQIRAELFAWLVWPALALLLLDAILRNTRLRRFP